MSEALNLVDLLPKKKLIIIDDDPSMTLIMQKVLEKNYEIVVIDNVSEALERCKRELPDGILLDLNMPNIDGFEFLSLMSNDLDICDIPTIAITANKSAKYRERAHQEGAIGIVYKPFDMLNLARDIEGVLKSTESFISSKNQRINYYMEFSESNKMKRLFQILSQQNFDSAPVVYLSWARGEDFLDDDKELNEQVKNENLIFLEIKPSLISKFPYIQNITPIVEEIKMFLPKSCRDYHLIMEEPRHLLNIHMREKSISQAYNMAQMLHTDFRKITYVNSRPHSEEAEKFLMKIGRILVGDLRVR